MSDDYEPLTVSELLLGRGGARVWALRRRRESPIAELAPGDVAKVRGRIEPVDALLEAPMGGEPCVLFEVRGAYWELGRAEPRLVSLERAQSDFWVVGASGRVLVRAGPLGLLLERQEHGRGPGRSGGTIPVPEPYRHERAGELPAFLVRAWLSPGQEVLVAGRIGSEVVTLDPTEGGYRDRTRRVPTIEPDEDRILTSLPELVRGT